MTAKSATLIDNSTGQRFELPILPGAYGPSVIDVQTLHKQTGMFTFDPGFLSTASCRSAITYINGAKGTLYYRGYPIEQLAEQSSHMEVCYLLLNGELPSADALRAFTAEIARHASLEESVRNCCTSARREAHPMAVCMSAVAALAAVYHDGLDIHDPEQRRLAAHRIIAKIPLIVACQYRHAQGLPFVPPRTDLPYAENFLHMLFSGHPEHTDASGAPCRISPEAARAMDLIFVLHADHEQNASTSTVRTAGSSGADPFAAIAAGFASLWGPAHGGANEAVIRMLEEIGTIENVPAYVARAEDKNDPFRLMGFGHRVYKNYDPRAKIMRQTCREVLRALGRGNQPLFETARELERIALEEEYFVKRNLYPNVDFYSGLILKAIGIPLNMFTTLFALARTAGWIAQWDEMLNDPDLRICRPRQLYTGPLPRTYPPLAERA